MAAVRRTALVTGASQGIGAAIALALAREGFDVAVTSTHPEKLEATLRAVKNAGGTQRHRCARQQCRGATA